jgi:hypothetical protein
MDRADSAVRAPGLWATRPKAKEDGELSVKALKKKRHEKSKGDGQGSIRLRPTSTWQEVESIGDKLINARAETIFEKPSFRKPMERQRCLIPIGICPRLL